MKYLLSFTLVAGLFICSCTEPEQPPPSVKQHAAKYPNQPQQYPPQQQPFNPNGPAQPENTPTQETAAGPAPTAAAPTKTSKGDYPYGIPVPGKKNLVESPYSPGKYVDVEGFPPGTEVKDPYTQKIFLVP
jgi:hypothetical protein